MTKYAALFLATVLLATVAVPAAADVPDPELNDVPEILISPDGSLAYEVLLIGQLGPVADQPVEIRFSPEIAALLCWCIGQGQTTITAVTNVQGVATFFIEGGGCVIPQGNPGARNVSVYAPTPQGDILLNIVGVVGPDAVDAQGRTPIQGWDPQGQCSVGLADATFHTGPIASGGYSYCSDLDTSLSVDLVDAVLITGPVTAGAACTQQ